MSNPKPNEHVQSLLNEQTQLLAQKGLIGEQLLSLDKRLGEVRAALEGVQLGQALAVQETEHKEAQLAAAKAVDAALEAQTPAE